jgi:hypothetical protein
MGGGCGGRRRRGFRTTRAAARRRRGGGGAKRADLQSKRLLIESRWCQNRWHSETATTATQQLVVWTHLLEVEHLQRLVRAGAAVQDVRGGLADARALHPAQHLQGAWPRPLRLNIA